jgi:hypothetical protein
MQTWQRGGGLQPPCPDLQWNISHWPMAHRRLMIHFNMDGAIFFLFILIMIAAIIYSIHHSKQVNQAWSEAGRILGLGFDAGGIAQSRKLTGKHEGHVVIVDTFTRRHGKSSTTYTRYSVMHARPLGLGLSLRKEGFFSGVAKAFGAQDIQIGDPAFDSTMLIKGVDPEAVKKFLTPERRNLIRQAMAESDSLEITDDGANMEVKGAADSSDLIVHNIRRLVQLVQVMGDAPESTIAAAPARSAPATLVIPAVAKPTPELEPIPVPEPEPIPTASEVADSLLAGNAGVTDLEQTFAARFAGQFIEGTGILRDWQRTGYDFDFDAGPCVRATVEVPLTAKDAYGRKHVEFILRLPPAAKAAAIGKEFIFNGTLFKVDSLMRRFFICCDE